MIFKCSERDGNPSSNGRRYDRERTPTHYYCYYYRNCFPIVVVKRTINSFIKRTIDRIHYISIILEYIDLLATIYVYNNLYTSCSRRTPGVKKKKRKNNNNNNVTENENGWMRNIIRHCRRRSSEIIIISLF